MDDQGGIGNYQCLALLHYPRDCLRRMVLSDLGSASMGLDFGNASSIYASHKAEFVTRSCVPSSVCL